MNAPAVVVSDAVALISTLPEVTAGATAGAAVAVAPLPSVPVATQASLALADAKGRPFDPVIHETTADGRPLLRTDGRTLRCRRNPLGSTVGKPLAKPQAAAPAPAAPAPAAIDPAPAAIDPVAPIDPAPAQAAGSYMPPDDPPAAPAAPAVGASLAKQREAAAKTLAACNVLVLRAALGKNLASGDDETAALAESWGAVLTHYGMETMHPLVGVALVNGALIANALNHEETQTRLEKIWTWTRGRMVRLWLWWKERKKPAAPASGE